MCSPDDEVPPESREGWYERQLRAGVQAVICHPKLVQTGLDLIEFPTILFYETGYSIYVLRQASRRSWRIGQRLPVKVKFLHYAETMQESCLRLMGRSCSCRWQWRASSFGRIASDQRRRRHPDGHGARTGNREGDRRASRPVWAHFKRNRKRSLAVRLRDGSLDSRRCSRIADSRKMERAIAPAPPFSPLATAAEPMSHRTFTTGKPPGRPTHSVLNGCGSP